MKLQEKCMWNSFVSVFKDILKYKFFGLKIPLKIFAKQSHDCLMFTGAKENNAEYT